MAEQTVLVIGGAGFVGRHVVRRLSAAGCGVWATFHSGRSAPAVPGVTWVRSDVSRADAAAAWPQRCDAVVYLAQSRTWKQFPATARDTFGVNVAGLMHAAWYAAEAGVGRFVYASTGSVYTQKARPAVEDEMIDLLEPRNFYVACKLAGELLLGAYHGVFPVIHLRLFFPYGDGQPEEMLMPRLVRCVQERRPIQLHGADGLAANPVAAPDVAEAVLRALELSRSETLNVGGPETLRLRDIGHAIGEVLGREPVFEVRPDEPAPVIAGDTSRLQKVLGWRPQTTLRDGLRQWLRPLRPAAVPA